MHTRFAFAPLVLLFAANAFADDARQLRVIPARGLGTVESVSVYYMQKGARVLAGELTKFDKSLTLPGEGPFEVLVKPKGGTAVRAVEKLTVKAGTTHELKLGDLLGAIEVFGDDLPRADKIVVTDVKDPGPGEKGHIALQTANDYRVDMLVAPGTYAVWVVPANGARAQRIADNVRVQAGRNVRVGE